MSPMLTRGRQDAMREVSIHSPPLLHPAGVRGTNIQHPVCFSSHGPEFKPQKATCDPALLTTRLWDSPLTTTFNDYEKYEIQTCSKPSNNYRKLP